MLECSSGSGREANDFEGSFYLALNREWGLLPREQKGSHIDRTGGKCESPCLNIQEWRAIFWCSMAVTA